MYAILLVFIILGALLITAMLTMLGANYTELGYGLHPALCAVGIFASGAAGSWSMGVLAELCGE